MNLSREISSKFVETVTCDEIGINGYAECFTNTDSGMLVAFSKHDSLVHFVDATVFMTPVLSGLFTSFLVFVFGMVFLVAYSSKDNS